MGKRKLDLRLLILLKLLVTGCNAFETQKPEMNEKWRDGGRRRDRNRDREKLTMSFNGNDKVRFELTLPLAPELNSSLP